MSLSLPARIALVGFMGSGKTTVGRLIAQRLSYEFADADEVIESRAKAKVGEIFKNQGEAAFRQLEQEAIRDLLQGNARVIATGGGAFAQASCAEELREGAFTVHLDCAFEEALRRAASQGNRPLLEQAEREIASLYAERKDKYARAHATVDTTLRTPEQVAEAVLHLLLPS